MLGRILGAALALTSGLALAEAAAATAPAITTGMILRTFLHNDWASATSRDYNDGPLEAPAGRGLARELHAKVLIGCTGESIIGKEHEVERGAALSVLAAVLPETTVQPFALASSHALSSCPIFDGRS